MISQSEWQLVTADRPSIDEGEVLGFNEKWIDEDFNPKGTRSCFRNDDGHEWISAKWCDMHDEYHTMSNREDTINKYDPHGAPTHYIKLPNSPGTPCNCEHGYKKKNYDQCDSCGGKWSTRLKK